MKISKKTDPLMNAFLYSAFSSIKLDIEGSNIDCVGWIPSPADTKYMDTESYIKAKKEGEKINEKVLFRNVSLVWDSCDCGDGYGCSHGGFVYEIKISNSEKVYTVEYADGDHLFFEGNSKMVQIPVASATIFDFIRACQLCEIELELSDYAVSLLSN